MAITSLYKQRAFLYRTSNSVGDFGQVTETLTLYASNVKCYVTQLSGNKPVYAGKLNVIATHRMFLSPQLVMKSSDRIYIVNLDQWFNILNIDNCSSLNHHWEILLEAIGEQVIQDLDESSSSESEGNESSSSSSQSSSSSSSEGI